MTDLSRFVFWWSGCIITDRYVFTAILYMFEECAPWVKVNDFVQSSMVKGLIPALAVTLDNLFFPRGVHVNVPLNSSCSATKVMDWHSVKDSSNRPHLLHTKETGDVPAGGFSLGFKIEIAGFRSVWMEHYQCIIKWIQFRHRRIPANFRNEGSGVIEVTWGQYFMQ